MSGWCDKASKQSPSMGEYSGLIKRAVVLRGVFERRALPRKLPDSKVIKIAIWLKLPLLANGRVQLENNWKANFSLKMNCSPRQTKVICVYFQRLALAAPTRKWKRMRDRLSATVDLSRMARFMVRGWPRHSRCPSTAIRCCHSTRKRENTMDPTIRICKMMRICSC